MRSEIEVKKRFLLICNDVVGKHMAGPAIRYVEMAKALSQFYDVTLVASGAGEVDFPELVLMSNAPEVVETQAEQADFVILQGDALAKYPSLKAINGVLIADLYCPIPLEYHQSSIGVAPDIRIQTAVYIARLMAEQLCFADHFICASEKQRDFWLGGLTVAGRINGLRWPDASHASIDELVSLVPFGLPDQLPEMDGPGLRERFSIPTDDFVAVWGGGIYQWFDPLTPIRAVHRLVKEGHRVHLVFMGIKHPNPDIHEHDMCAHAVGLANELGLTDHYVHFNFGWVDYSHRQNFFLEADVGVSAHFDNPETRFAFRTRMLDYLWCGLPIVSTRGDVFAEHVQDHQLGMVVGFNDVVDWYVALKRMKDDKEFHSQCKQQIAEFSQAFAWSSIMQRFAHNIGKVAVAADREAIRKSSAGGRTNLGIGAKLRQAYAEGGWRRVGYLTGRRLGIFFKVRSVR